jgi:ribosomal protein L29
MPENPGKIRALKRAIARINTIKKEMEVAKK